MSYKTNVRKSMKLSVLFIFLVLLLSDLNAQNQDLIQSIRQHYNYVNNNLHSFRLAESETFDESTDGAEISKYPTIRRLTKNTGR